MAKETTISVYGVFQTPEEIERDRQDKIMGIVRYHETTYLEYDIPALLETELTEMIEKRITEFENQCQCEDCKNERNKPTNTNE